jgi:hypothetical protein
MRRPPLKYVGLAGLAGVAATGVVVARRRRAQQQVDPDELRARLHDRLAQVERDRTARLEDGPRFTKDPGPRT